MPGDDVEFQTRTVKAVRGTESVIASKWEKQGWEVVSKTPGTLSTELTIRRPKPKTPWMWIGIGAAAALVVVAIIVVGAINERSAPATAETSSADPSEPAESAAPEPSASDTDVAEPVIITASDPAFASILALTDYCSPEIAAFAAEHAGETVEFDASIGAMNNHDGATTRYDILVGAGDFSETSGVGPAFQFRDVNTTTDLNYSGSGETVGVGDNIHVVAEVVEYESSTCLFLLDPVETSSR